MNLFDFYSISKGIGEAGYMLPLFLCKGRDRFGVRLRENLVDQKLGYLFKGAAGLVVDFLALAFFTCFTFFACFLLAAFAT